MSNATWPMQPVLQTERLKLRPADVADTGLISLYTSDIRVARMTSRIPHPNPPGAVEAYLETLKKTPRQELVWVVDGTPGFGTPVTGMISLSSDGEIGYWIAPFFWGLGIATEALRAVVGYARSRGDKRVWAGVFNDNPASINVLEKSGLKPFGTRTIFSVGRDQNVDGLLMEKVLDDG